LDSKGIKNFNPKIPTKKFSQEEGGYLNLRKTEAVSPIGGFPGASALRRNLCANSASSQLITPKVD